MKKWPIDVRFFLLYLSTVVILSPALLWADPGPERIVSLNLCTDELLLKLANESQIAAITHYSADPEASVLFEKAKHILKIQGKAEEVLSLHPTLVFDGIFSDRSTRMMLERFKIPLVTVSLPKSFDEIFNNVRQMAEPINQEQKGEELISEMKGRLAKLKPQAFGKRAIFYQTGGFTPGAETFENAILEVAGFKNLAAELGIRGYGRVSLENLITSHPDLIIFLTDSQIYRAIRGELLNHPAIGKALKDTLVLTLPASWLHCGSTESIRAAEAISKVM